MPDKRLVYVAIDPQGYVMRAWRMGDPWPDADTLQDWAIEGVAVDRVTEADARASLWHHLGDQDFLLESTNWASPAGGGL